MAVDTPDWSGDTALTYWDGQVGLEAALGVQILNTPLAVAGKIYIVSMISAALVQSTGAAGTVQFQITDVILGTLFDRTLSLNATAGDRDAINMTNLAIRCSVGQAPTFQFSAGFVGAFQSLSVAWFLR